MPRESCVAVLSRLGAETEGVFRGRDAVARGVTRNQLNTLLRGDVIARMLPDTYRMTAVPRSRDQELRSALLWAGDDAAASGRSAAERYGLEGVRAETPPRRSCSRTGYTGDRRMSSFTTPLPAR